MNDIQIKAVKAIINTPAWEEVEAIFLEEAKTREINTEGKTADMIALDYMAQQSAGDKIKKIIAKLNRIGRNNQDIKKENWR
jgi:hypothetical protein